MSQSLIQGKRNKFVSYIVISSTFSFPAHAVVLNCSALLPNGNVIEETFTIDNPSRTSFETWRTAGEYYRLTTDTALIRIDRTTGDILYTFKNMTQAKGSCSPAGERKF